MRLITTEDDNEITKKDNPRKSSVQLELGPFVEVLTKQLSNKAIQTRIAVLRWVLQLHMKVPNKVRARNYCQSTFGTFVPLYRTIDL